MSRLGLTAALIASVLAVPARSDTIRREDVVRELEERASRMARDLGPSIARILVSRSSAYYKAPLWGTPLAAEYPGQLGRFNADAARKKVPAEARFRARVLRTIAAHDLSDPDNVPESYGSGFVIGREGLVLTNAHVVRNATKIYVRLPGKRGSWADIHASDPRSDLAVLRLLDPPADLKPVPLGDASSVTRGQTVISLSNPFAPGFRGSDGPTLGHGWVNNLHLRAPGNPDEMERRKVTLHHYGTLILADADRTGCSGGALLNLDGKVIGITTALLGVRGEGPGSLAIPIDSSVQRIIEVLRKGEEVEYGFLGVALSRFGGEDGVMLDRITSGSPAARAGLQMGDRIVAINDQKVTKSHDLFLYIGMALAGSPTRIKVRRRGEFADRDITVKLSKYYVPGPVIAAKRPPARFGLRVDYTSILAQREVGFWSRWPGDGVIVREVVPGSPADSARLQPDKVITQVNGKIVATPAEYYAEMARAGKKVELTYLTSDGRAQQLTLEEK